MDDTIKNGLIEAGAWIGRTQAFGVIANKCSAAEAEALRQARQNRTFQAVGLPWGEYCNKYFGISRKSADTLIERLLEFGEMYFRVSELAHVSAAVYRKLTPSADGDAIEIAGESIDVIPENAPKIRAALNSLRTDLRLARSRSLPTLADLRARLDAVVGEIDRVAKSHEDAPTEDFRALVQQTIQKLSRHLS